jgi:mannose-6-phosphate isomerase-like protein (cupin superfamily)
MLPPKAVTLSETHVHIRPHGPAEFLAKDFSNVTKSGETTFIWDPKVDGILGGEGIQSKSSDHAGERHLDGDELLYLISGILRLSLEYDDGSTAEVPLHPGQAVIVPRGIWHRLVVDEPGRLLFFGGGRTEIKRA